MRISNNMMMDRALIDINNNLTSIDQSQQNIATGKRIHRPQDDPTANARAMVLRNSMDQNTQYISNIKLSQDYLSTSESAMTSALNVVQRLRQLAIEGANNTLQPNDKQAIVTEATQLREELRALGNTQVNGRYVFGGLKVDQAPYPVADVTTGPNDPGVTQIEVAPGVLVNTNVTAVQMFGNTLPGQTNNVFAAVDSLVNTLTASIASSIDTGKLISTQTLPLFDNALAAINNTRTTVGATLNRLEMASGRLTDTNVSLDNLLQGTEDTDMAAETMKLNQSQAAYQASLSVAARALPMSLVDFLH